MGSTLAARQGISRTAYDCAAVRAAVHAWTGCDAGDYLAARLVRGPSASVGARLGVMLARAGASGLTRRLIARSSPGAEVLLFARQAVPDELVREALRDDPATRIVLLGGGLDTSGLRIGAERRRAGADPGCFFEVDLPPMLAEKRRLVAGLRDPAGQVLGAGHIRYVPCTFGAGELPAALLAAGFDPAQRSLWVWSGVLHYLSEAAVAATLGELRSLASPGSLLFFDYVLREAYERPSAYAFGRLKARFDRFGEVMSFGLREGVEPARQWLAGHGLRLMRHYSHRDMVATYERLTGHPAPSAGPPWSGFCVAAF